MLLETSHSGGGNQQHNRNFTYNIVDSSNKGSAASSSRFRVAAATHAHSHQNDNIMNNSNRKSDFLDRFQGKTTQMKKDGHLGLVERAGNHPIPKPLLQRENIPSFLDQQQMLLGGASQRSNIISGSAGGHGLSLPQQLIQHQQSLANSE